MSDVESSGFPPNVRIDTIVFDDDARSIRVALRGVEEPKDFAAASILGLFGGRIRHDSVTTTSAGGGINFGKLAITVATGIPVGVSNKGPKEKSVVGKDFHHALALRVADVPIILYLLAASFNFRKSLGAESTYSTETNLKLFVKRLAAFAPQAAKDEYIAATVGNTPLPDPLDSLLDFFRATFA
jgi:hypothetical protein